MLCGNLCASNLNLASNIRSLVCRATHHELKSRWGSSQEELSGCNEVKREVRCAVYLCSSQYIKKIRNDCNIPIPNTTENTNHSSNQAHRAHRVRRTLYWQQAPHSSFHGMQEATQNTTRIKNISYLMVSLHILNEHNITRHHANLPRARWAIFRKFDQHIAPAKYCVLCSIILLI